MDFFRKNGFWFAIGTPVAAALFLYLFRVRPLDARFVEEKEKLENTRKSFETLVLAKVVSKAKRDQARMDGERRQAELDACLGFLRGLDAPLDDYPLKPEEREDPFPFVQEYKRRSDALYAAARAVKILAEGDDPAAVFHLRNPNDLMAQAQADPQRKYRQEFPLLHKQMLILGELVDRAFSPLANGYGRLKDVEFLQLEPVPAWRGQPGVQAFEFIFKVETTYQRVPLLLQHLYESRLTLFVPRAISLSRAPEAPVSEGTPVTLEVKCVAYDFDLK